MLIVAASAQPMFIQGQPCQENVVGGPIMMKFWTGSQWVYFFCNGGTQAAPTWQQHFPEQYYGQTGNGTSQVCHATYSVAVDGGGAPGLVTPAANCTIPANAIIYNEIIDWTTAATGTGGTATIGTTGTGGGAAILQASGTVGTGLSGIVQGVIVPQTASGFKKLTTAGTVTVTTGTAALTAGVCEIYVFYVVSPT